jgi:hypothetical protein
MGAEPKRERLPVGDDSKSEQASVAPRIVVTLFRPGSNPDIGPSFLCRSCHFPYPPTTPVNKSFDNFGQHFGAAAPAGSTPFFVGWFSSARESTARK